MSKLELRLQIQLHGDVLFAVFRLPPPFAPISAEGGGDVFNAVAPAVSSRDVRHPRVTVKALVFAIVKVTDDAVAAGAMQAAGGTGLQAVLAAVDQVTRGWVA